MHQYRHSLDDTVTSHTHISFGILVSFPVVTFLFEHFVVLFLFVTFPFVSFLLCLGFPFEIRNISTHLGAGVDNFLQKLKSCYLLLNTRRVTCSKFYTENKQLWIDVNLLPGALCSVPVKWYTFVHKGKKRSVQSYVTSTINQQMHLFNFHLKHFKTLKTTPTYFDLFRTSSGSFVVPC